MTPKFGIALAALGSACVVLSPASGQDAGTVAIEAVRETAPVMSPGDAADDPAIWRNPVDPAESLIVATDKEWGLNVYDLTGALLASTSAGLVNNVDLRAGVLVGGQPAVLVAASDRSEDPIGRIALYVLESSPVGLRHLAHVVVESDGKGDVYGFCLWRRGADDVFAFIPFNNGNLRQYALDLSGDAPTATFVREIGLDSQTEGCVADDRTGMVYVGEEERGVWRLNADPASNEAPVLFASIADGHLIPDVEGLAIVPDGEADGFLLVSSQADNPPAGAPRQDSAFVAYDLASGRFVRRFRVSGAGDVDGAVDTDGLEFAPGNFGAPFDDGVLIVQDGDNKPHNQNFKMVPGNALKALLNAR
jgi:3-phytase